MTTIQMNRIFLVLMLLFVGCGDKKTSCLGCESDEARVKREKTEQVIKDAQERAIRLQQQKGE
jgi:hypothetical protein